MATRRGRKGQFKKSSRRRTSKYKKAISIPATVGTLVSVNALSHALTGLGPMDFLGLGDVNAAGWAKSGDPHNVRITLKELMDGKNIGATTTLGKAMKWNLTNNGLSSIGMIVGFKVAEKMMKGLGINRQLNKAIRSTGLGNMVKF